MRPSAIRVFDGLRVTTEHVDHLQAALDTSVRDLREIVGIGRVHRGFEVRATGPDRIEIGPGLAFDRLGYRLVTDERQTLDVAFAEDAADLLVCIRHEQVEAGEVEGVATLVFDSCAAFLAHEPPGPGDLSIVVARLARSDEVADPPAFDVVDMRWPDEPAPKGEPAPLPEVEGAAEDAGVTGSPASAPAPVPQLAAARGLLELGPAPDAAPDLAALAAGRLVLGEAAVPVPFEPALLSVDVLLSAEITLPARSEGETSDPPLAATLNVAATARGEATVDVDGIDQHGLSVVQVGYTRDGEPTTGWTASLLAEGQLAGFDLERLLADSPVREAGPVGAALAELELAVAAERTPDAVVVRCWLGWKGAVDSELLAGLAAAAPALGWTAHVAWRGVGTGPSPVNVQPAGGA